MISNKINLCYICNNFEENSSLNNYYFEMLKKSLITLNKYYYNSIENLYIFIDNLSNINYKEIYDIISSNINIIIKKIDLNITKVFKYPLNNINNYKINNIGLLKFLIPYLVDCDNILYCDCDILFYNNVINDIIENFNENTLIKVWGPFGINSGLIYFNCINWRNNKELLSDIIEYYNKNYTTLQYVDNATIAWIAEISKYKNICYIEINKKNINVPCYNIEKFNEINIIHVWGGFDTKNKYFNEIYKKIINN